MGWFKKLFETHVCVDCKSRSEEKIQSPKGPMFYYCFHPKNNEKVFSFVEGRDVQTSYPCHFSNASGRCSVFEAQVKI